MTFFRPGSDARMRNAMKILLKKGGKNRARALNNATHPPGADVASAATLVLKDPTSRVTGAATVTAIAEARKYEIRRVVFDGGCTLVHSANLIMPGEANRLTEAEDDAEFISLGDGIWKCSRYTLADGTLLGVVPIVKGGTSATTEVDALDNLHIQSTDIASATIVDLSAATGQFVRITGTTQIEGFTEKTAGNQYTLSFEDVLTLKHSASLKLPNGQDIVTDADFRLTIVSRGV